MASRTVVLRRQARAKAQSLSLQPKQRSQNSTPGNEGHVKRTGSVSSTASNEVCHVIYRGTIV